MAETTILQNWVFTQFILPFLLMFTVIFAVLEKTKLFGDEKKQVDAIVSFVIALIFVSVVYPKLVVTNLILFLTVAIIVLFVVLLLWGFVSGETPKVSTGWVKWTVGVVIVVAVAIAFIWAAGIQTQAYELVFKNAWGNEVFINALFIIAIAVVVAVVVKSGKD